MGIYPGRPRSSPHGGDAWVDKVSPIFSQPLGLIAFSRDLLPYSISLMGAAFPGDGSDRRNIIIWYMVIYYIIPCYIAIPYIGPVARDCSPSLGQWYRPLMRFCVSKGTQDGLSPLPVIISSSTRYYRLRF